MTDDRRRGARRLLSLVARLLGDVQAVLRGTIGRRIVRRVPAGAIIALVLAAIAVAAAGLIDVWRAAFVSIAVLTVVAGVFAWRAAHDLQARISVLGSVVTAASTAAVAVAALGLFHYQRADYLASARAVPALQALAPEILISRGGNYLRLLLRVNNASGHDMTDLRLGQSHWDGVAWTGANWSQPQRVTGWSAANVFIGSETRGAPVEFLRQGNKLYFQVQLVWRDPNQRVRCVNEFIEIGFYRSGMSAEPVWFGVAAPVGSLPPVIKPSTDIPRCSEDRR